MKRVLLVFIAALVCLGGGAVFLLERGVDGGTVTPSELSARASFSKNSVLFGDTVDATLDLIIPHSLAGIAFKGTPNFRPFRILSTHVDRAAVGGGLEQISFRYVLTCLSPRCVSAGASTSKAFGFPPAVFSARGGPTLRAKWPTLVAVSRVDGVTTPTLDGLRSVPAVFPGLQPRTYADEALVAAVVSLVALVAAWFYVRLRVRRRIEAAARAQTLLQALLARVEAGLPEDVIYQQRHALDALAVELRHRHIDGTLALRAERLAWAPEHPDPVQIRALCAEIRDVAKA